MINNIIYGVVVGGTVVKGPGTQETQVLFLRRGDKEFVNLTTTSIVGSHNSQNW